MRPECDAKYNLKIIDQDLELLDALAKQADVSRAQLLNHLLWDAIRQDLSWMPADKRAWFLLAADEDLGIRAVDTPWVSDFYADAMVAKATEDREREPHSYEYSRMLGLVGDRGDIVRSYIDISNPPVYEYVTLRPEPKLQAMLKLFAKHDVWRGIHDGMFQQALRRFALSSREHAYIVEELTKKYLPDGPHRYSVLGLLLSDGIVTYDVIECDEDEE